MTRSQTLTRLARQLDDKVNELADRMLGGTVAPAAGGEQATQWLPQTFYEMMEAKARVTAGAYGQCAECRRDIPLARLRIKPFAVRCTHCQEQHELRVRVRE
jgi:hypothetical protein